MEDIIRKLSPFDLSSQMQINCREDIISPEDIKSADEVFITSTAGGVMPITKIDNWPIGDGLVGPFSKRITKGYWQLHENDHDALTIKYPL